MIPAMGIAENGRRYDWVKILGAVLAAGCVMVLFFFSPEQFHFYPRCLLYMCTGLQCPGCGGLRAMHQLLHGNVVAAFHFNPFFVSLSPLILFGLGAKHFGFGQIAAVFQKAWFWIAFAVCAFAFGIWRNLH